jgi:hypothetical protein
MFLNADVDSPHSFSPVKIFGYQNTAKSGPVPFWRRLAKSSQIIKQPFARLCDGEHTLHEIEIRTYFSAFFGALSAVLSFCISFASFASFAVDRFIVDSNLNY